ncbi:MAG: type III-A CRISPR-associated RAMP protein Csm3 [Acidobacteriota bacterium]|nr:type III-A CRISPR-associated RAMP protein Csm3 [Blastocatellia bacterium]MDW8412373.1 type III-A CRISPR-associated RAMP protein Csm3 [Acidobacteriota bacterium]
MNQTIGTLIIYGKIECITGLHIGGTEGGYEIGGIDNPVIRDPIDGFPYIPGSSLKGKMRSLMEWAEGKVTSDGQVYSSGDVNDVISRLFGAPAEKDRKAGPTRLIVRDAKADKSTREKLEKLEAEQGLPRVEIKTEVSINRLTSKPPSGPRHMERVPAGSKFDFEILFNLYEVESISKKDIDLIPEVFMAMRLLEHSALGGSGSRGYGQIAFHLGEPIVYTLNDYRKGITKEKKKPDELHPLSKFNTEKIEGIKELFLKQEEVYKDKSKC